MRAAEDDHRSATAQLGIEGLLPVTTRGNALLGIEIEKDVWPDELQMKRLKRRKLLLKDQIARLESQLIPDLNA